MTTKSKVLDISGVEKKKKIKLPKKLTKSTALALVEKPEPKKISKLNTKGMRSILGDSAEEIQQLLEINNTDSATTLMQKRMMQTVVDLIPYAEHAVRKSKGARGVYQINSLLTSLRELMLDVQATKDKGSIGDAMVEKVIRPAFLDIGMKLVLEDERVLKEIKDDLDPASYKAVRDVHRESLKRLAASIQEQYAHAKTQAIAFLQQ
jgi:hypothetical protein